LLIEVINDLSEIHLHFPYSSAICCLSFLGKAGSNDLVIIFSLLQALPKECGLGSTPEVAPKVSSEILVEIAE